MMSINAPKQLWPPKFVLEWRSLCTDAGISPKISSGKEQTLVHGNYQFIWTGHFSGNNVLFSEPNFASLLNSLVGLPLFMTFHFHV